MPRRPSTHVDDPAAVGRRLREERERAGLTQRQLAFPGCTAAYISRVEAGARIPSLQILRELARRIGTTEDFLATGSVDGAIGFAARLGEADAAVRLGELSTAAEIYEAVLDAHSTSDEQAAASIGLAEVAYRQGDPARVVELLEPIAATLGGVDPRTSSWIADRLGRAYAHLGEYDRSVAAFEHGLEIAREHADHSAELRLSTLLANSVLDCGNPGRAEELLAGVVRFAERARDPLDLARLWWSEARVHIHQGRGELAARYLRQTIAVLDAREHTDFAATAFQLLARIENDRQNFTQALGLIEEGESLATQGGNRYHLALFEVERARALAGVGDIGKAGSVAHRAAALLEQTNPVGAGYAYRVIARVFEQLGDRPRAREIYELAVERLDPTDPLQADVNAALGELWEAEGNSVKAMAAYKQAAQIRARAAR